eukprot:COSAG01_NODE_88_length_27337_cov_22.941699_12_plen_90_part_00
MLAEMRSLLKLGEGRPLPSLEGDDNQGRYATSWCTQFRVLFARTARIKFRDPMSFGTGMCVYDDAAVPAWARELHRDAATGWLAGWLAG